MFDRIELDIGSGSGYFTLEAATRNPKALFVGLDINADLIEAADQKRKSAGLTNIIFQHAEAQTFLSTKLLPSSVDAFHIYFPTPYFGTLRRNNILAANIRSWLMSPPFLSEVQRTAKRRATLRLVTDHSRYFEYSAKLLALAGFTFTEWTSPINQDRSLDKLVGSGCERSMRSINREIKFLQCVAR